MEDPELALPQFTLGDLSKNGVIPRLVFFDGVGGVDGVEYVEDVGGVDGLGSRGIRGGRDSDGLDLRDGLIGGRYTRLISSAPASEFG